MRSAVRILGAMLATGMAAGLVIQIPVHAAVENGWEIVDGIAYWYEGGVKQGTEGRGKEIYDPGSDAWYWLDAVDGGRMAKAKDVYQESQADSEGNIGKWVRYDNEGHMIKGWSITEAGIYYFDLVYGTMAKGSRCIDGVEYFFNQGTGIMEDCSISLQNHWETIDGKQYWYEGGVRQGYNPLDGAYRGKEIYDPGSNAWYWLDNVQQGAKAVGKDVYQESQADDAGNIGKWVRYDAEGHMVKGWSTDERGSYYFDPVYGTMAKGTVTIDGTAYHFDESSGICDKGNQTSVKPDTSGENKPSEKDDQNEYDEEGRLIKKPFEKGDGWFEYRYDENGNKIKEIEYNGNGGVNGWIEYQYGSNGKLRKENFCSEDGYVYRWNEYDELGRLIKEYPEKGGPTEYQYDSNGYLIKELNYDGQSGNVFRWTEYQYDINGNRTSMLSYYADGKVCAREEYQYDDNGNKIAEIKYDENGGITNWWGYQYDEEGNLVKWTGYDAGGIETGWIGYEYDDKGNKIAETNFDRYGNMVESYKYQYNDNGELIKTIFVSYNSDGQCTESRYDENQKLTEKIFYDMHGEMTGWWGYQYDEKGNLVKWIGYGADGKVTGWTGYEYNANGKKMKEIFVSYGADEKVAKWTEKHYNESGKLIKDVFCDADGKTTGWWEYQYDDNGKAIKWIVYDANGNVTNEGKY